MLRDVVACPLLWREPARLTNVTAWHQHIPFAFFLVWKLKPRVVVELGTHRGDSYGAFCQAVRETGIPSRCHAVDTWQGDEHTGAYDEGVYQDLRQHHDPRYGGFSTLHRTTFDAAAQEFAPGSIDLLHIDGLHTYEAVRHDIDTWLPRVRPGGVVLLHDTAVRDRGFGVHRCVEELAARHPVFEFPHGNGLAVVFVGDPATHPLQAWAKPDPQDAELVRLVFRALGEAVDWRGQLVNLQSHLDVRERDLGKRVGELVADVARLEAEKSRMADDLHAARRKAEALEAYLEGLAASAPGRIASRLRLWNPPVPAKPPKP